MPKVEYKDLEEITKFLDKLVKDPSCFVPCVKSQTRINKADFLSQKIKDKYTEIKPDYER